MHRNSNITDNLNSTLSNAGIFDFGHLQHVDFQHLFRCKNTPSFTGKEKDSETGFYYFGARYYDPSLSGLFLSVDPMADKYPSLSPYAYCAWNPVKLVDPEGDSVKVVGSQSEEIVKNLQTDKLNISRNDNGYLNVSLGDYSVDDLSNNERLVYNAITCDRINITIYAETMYESKGNRYFAISDNGKMVNVKSSFGASFCGAYRNDKTGKVDTYSFIDIEYMQSLGYDQGVPHEITENYYAGLFVLTWFSNIPYADISKSNSKILASHNAAIPQTVGDGMKYTFGPKRGGVKLSKMKSLLEILIL